MRTGQVYLLRGIRTKSLQLSETPSRRDANNTENANDAYGTHAFLPVHVYVLQLVVSILTLTVSNFVDSPSLKT